MSFMEKLEVVLVMCVIGTVTSIGLSGSYLMFSIALDLYSRGF